MYIHTRTTVHVSATTYGRASSLRGENHRKRIITTALATRTRLIRRGIVKGVFKAHVAQCTIHHIRTQHDNTCTAVRSSHRIDGS